MDGAVEAQPRKVPPGPKGLPVLGNLHQARHVLSFFTRCARRYGDVVALRLGSWPALLLSNPDDIESVLVKNRSNFIKHRFFWRHTRAIFGNGVLTSEGDLWARQRRLAAPAFTGPHLDEYGDEVVRCTQHAVEGWKTGDVRNIHNDMMSLTLRIGAKSLFGSELSGDVAAIAQAANVLTAEIGSRLLSRPFFIHDAVPLPGNIRYRRNLRIVENAVERIIQDRRSSGESRSDVLSMLISARSEDGTAMSDVQLRDEVITMLLAGHETTALALTWTSLLLGQHPEVQARLRAEIQAVLGGRAATAQDISSLRLAEQVVMEAMRLYPPAWSVGREALADCEIGGYRVPAGTTIYMSQWIVQRDPRYYDNPAEFRPERWDGDLAKTLPRFAYFPFGGGPRICLAMRFAMIEAILVLVTTLQRFELEWVGKEPVQPSPSITLRPKGAVWIKLKAA